MGPTATLIKQVSKQKAWLVPSVRLGWYGACKHRNRIRSCKCNHMKPVGAKSGWYGTCSNPNQAGQYTEGLVGTICKARSMKIYMVTFLQYSHVMYFHAGWCLKWAIPLPTTPQKMFWREVKKLLAGKHFWRPPKHNTQLPMVLFFGELITRKNYEFRREGHGLLFHTSLAGERDGERERERERGEERTRDFSKE